MMLYRATCKLYGDTVETRGSDLDDVMTRIHAIVPNGWWDRINVYEREVPPPCDPHDDCTHWI